MISSLRAEPELFEDVGEAHVLDRLVDHQPHRAFVAVADDVDHRVAKALVAHAGHRHQKLSLEGIHRTFSVAPNLLHIAMAAICRSRRADRCAFIAGRILMYRGGDAKFWPSFSL